MRQEGNPGDGKKGGPSVKGRGGLGFQKRQEKVRKALVVGEVARDMAALQVRGGEVADPGQEDTKHRQKAIGDEKLNSRKLFFGPDFFLAV